MEILDIGFIILHYQVYEETINCVNSIIKNIDTDAYKIIIVDNFSPNKSGKYLYEYYNDENKIIVIELDKNLGFAKGNNRGIDFLRDKYDVNFICCLNNDTILFQKCFYGNIYKEFKKSNCAIIGPQIILENNEIFIFGDKLHSKSFYIDQLNKLCQYDSNNDKKNSLSNKKLKNKVRHNKFISKFLNIFYVYKYKSHFRKENVLLHGCCLIFTPIFFNKMDGFDSRTFLYKEEQLLYLKAKRNGLLTVYNPKIKIKHLEDRATNYNERKSSELKCRYEIQSLKILISELEQEELKHNG